MTPAWFDITARDAERSREFYAQLFGWDVRFDESMDYALVGDTPTGGIGQTRDGYPHPPGVVVYFTVEDVEAALQEADRLGGSRAVPPWEIPGLGKMAVFQDPDGNRVGLWQR